ncbi:hypothetical protein KR018_005987 [Drosophila ironensis]|nr:hypothetical protein KR018_005987 [Drosophila ironensis]
MPPKHRDVAPFLSRVRDFLLGRTHLTGHRFADTSSPRTQPHPDVPSGQLDSLTVSYFDRDPRRAVKPPVDLMQEQKKLLAVKAKLEAKKTEPCEQQKQADHKEGKKKLPTPGITFSWEGPE